MENMRIQSETEIIPSKNEIRALQEFFETENKFHEEIKNCVALS